MGWRREDGHPGGVRAARLSARDFAGAREGIAILEFALILPVLMLLYFGTVELTNLMRNARKVDMLSRTIGDLVGQRTQLTSAEMADIFRSAGIVLSPFGSDGLQMSVSAVGVLSNQDAGPLQVCSSAAAANSTIRITGQVAPVSNADSQQAAGSRMLLVEIVLPYKSITGDAFQNLTGFVLSRKTLWPVRAGRRYASLSPEVLLPLGTACPSR